jgi:GT2 family glycosyltransferase
MRQSARGVIRRIPVLRKAVDASQRHIELERQRGPLAITDHASIAAAEASVRKLIVGDSPSSSPKVPTPTTELHVAIVVPAFADSRYLHDCLESVRRQTFPNWVCYVVDDASPEDVGSIVESFRKKDARFVSARHGRNAGLSAARNTGLLLTDAPLVQFLDADDMLTPWALERRVARIAPLWDSAEVAGAYGRIVQCSDESTVDDLRSWTRESPLHRVDWISSKGDSPFNAHAPLIRTALVKQLGGFDESMVNGAEDWDLWTRILRHGFVFEPTAAIVGAYRQRASSMVRDHAHTHLRRADALLTLAESWVTVDTEIAVSNADMPISVASDALARTVRAARYAGIAASGSGDATSVVDDSLRDFSHAAALPSARRSDVVAAAKSGLIRGLGLGSDSARRLSAETLTRVEAAATTIADQMLATTTTLDTTEQRHDLRSGRQATIALVGDTLADVESLISTGRDLAGSDDTVVAIDLSAAQGDQGTHDGWVSAGLPIFSSNDFELRRCAPSRLIVSSPPGPALQRLMRLATERDVDVIELDGRERALSVDHDRAEERNAGSAVHFSQLLPAEEGFIDEENTSRILALRNRHIGQTAVIIGNGPSLNQTDLGLLGGHVTFGVNSIFLADDRLPEPLTYYVVEDQAVFRENTAEIKAYQAGTKLFPSNYRHYFSDDQVTANTAFFRMNAGFYGRGTGTYCHPRFSTDVSQRVFCGQSVTIANLQLAFWMGVQRVVLIGMDFSYSIPSDAERRGDVIVSQSDDPNHFDPRYFGAGKTWHDPKLDRVLVNYRLADEVYHAAGREIVNATVGGRLEVFPRMDLRSALADVAPLAAVQTTEE